MRTHVRRPYFDRTADWVVVARHRLTSTTFLEPGMEIMPGQFRRHRLMSMWQRRRIGPKGHPWTEAMLAAGGGERARPEAVGVRPAAPTLKADPSCGCEKPETALTPIKDGARRWIVPGYSNVFVTKKAAAEFAASLAAAS